MPKNTFRFQEAVSTSVPSFLFSCLSWLNYQFFVKYDLCEVALIIKYEKIGWQ